MKPEEKYNLTEMLNEIDEDAHEQKKDHRQEKDIPQDTINELMLSNLQKKGNRPPEQ